MVDLPATRPYSEAVAVGDVVEIGLWNSTGDAAGQR